MSRILVIEDEQDLGSLLEYNLRTDGHEAEVVRTGAAGVSKAKSWKPDLILLDINMPGKTGFDLLQELDRSPFVIFTTAYDEYAVKAFEVNRITIENVIIFILCYIYFNI